MERIEHHACFGGRQEVWKHESTTLGCEMRFAVYLPPAALAGQKCSVLYWLSGLTCTEQNFITKAGAQQHAAQHRLIIVAPDTSPRGSHVPNDPAYDLGQGAGFYINATQQPWAQHFQMESYVINELRQLVEQHFQCTDKRGIFGHSMGGHGALTLALKFPHLYQTVSAFSPIVAPSQVPWGQKAFTAYLGADVNEWRKHDAVESIASFSGTQRPELLIDQGSDDEFLNLQLRPELLEQACEQYKHPLRLRRQAGYDHSYYFIASFIGEHVAHHAQGLG